MFRKGQQSKLRKDQDTKLHWGQAVKLFERPITVARSGSRVHGLTKLIKRLVRLSLRCSFVEELSTLLHLVSRSRNISTKESLESLEDSKQLTD